MQFTTLAVAAMATVAIAGNTVTFLSMDDTDRTIVWTGEMPIDDTIVLGGQNVSVSVPTGYIGNAYSYNDGADNIPGMLAEFAFNGWGGSTYFDVSAIVNPDDHSGVFQMYPADDESPMSGCQSFACNNAYYLWDDVQTKVTPSNHIIVTLGEGPIELSTKRNVGENHPREALTNPHYKPALTARFKSALRWARKN